MKKITYILSIIILLSVPSNAEDISDCTKLKKLSKEYVSCKSKNLKTNISKKKNPFKKFVDYQKKAWSKKDK